MYMQLKERLYPGGKTYLFLDEVQEIKGWERVVNSLASDFDVDLYVTGSNSRMMSSEISTYLTGRYVSFRIFTLSFGEYLTFRSKFTSVREPKAELADYIRLGGFPAAHLQAFSQDEIYTIVRDIYNSTIFSDIVRRNRIRKIDQLERVVKYTFSNVARRTSGLRATHRRTRHPRTDGRRQLHGQLRRRRIPAGGLRNGTVRRMCRPLIPQPEANPQKHNL